MPYNWMEFITREISFPDCGLLEKSEAAVEFCETAAVIQQHFILRLVTT